MKLIESQVVGSGGASSITIGSGGTIPQTYSHLVIYASVASTGGTVFDSLRCKFNNDASTSGYACLIAYGNTSGWTYTTQTETSAFFGDGAGNTSGTGKFGASRLFIPDYTTSLKKQWIGYTTSASDNSDVYLEPIAGKWDYTNAITSLVFSASSGDLKQYSRIDVYGIE